MAAKQKQEEEQELANKRLLETPDDQLTDKEKAKVNQTVFSKIRFPYCSQG